MKNYRSVQCTEANREVLPLTVGDITCVDTLLYDMKSFHKSFVVSVVAQNR